MIFITFFDKNEKVFIYYSGINHIGLRNLIRKGECLK